MGVDCGRGLLGQITYMAVVGSCMCMVCGYMHILAAIKEVFCLGVGCHEFLHLPWCRSECVCWVVVCGRFDGRLCYVKLYEGL